MPTQVTAAALCSISPPDSRTPWTMTVSDPSWTQNNPNLSLMHWNRHTEYILAR